MKTNKLEFLAMNNRVRARIQEKYEVPILQKMSSGKIFQNVLEIGCGNGTGTKLIRRYFTTGSITAIDLDEKMLVLAEKSNKDPNVTFKLMDASRLDFPENHFDAVFDFGIIHHIPNWRDCLTEIKRVLKPGGELILEDLSIDSFTTGIGKLWRILSLHPYDLMYTPGQFTEYLNEIGFTIRNYKEFNPYKFVRFFSLNATRA